MNIKNLTKAVQWLEGDAKPVEGTIIGGFDMSVYFHDTPDEATPACQTTCCIAGFIIANTIKRGEHFDNGDNSYATTAKKLYGLTDNQAFSLFHGPRRATPAQAARCIRNLIDTGRVDWCY